MANAASLVRAAIAEIRRGRIIQTDGLAEAAAEIDRLTEANAALMAERTSLIETKREQIERLTAELAETKRLSLADRAVISAQKQQLDRLVRGDKSPVAHAFQMQVNALTAELASALAKLAQYEQAPVVGWKLMHPLLHTRFSLHPITDGDRSLGWTDTALIARPEVTK
jgi:hypothetical protein